MNIKTQDSTYCTNGRPSIYFIVFGPSFREDMFRGSWWCSGAVSKLPCKKIWVPEPSHKVLITQVGNVRKDILNKNFAKSPTTPHRDKHNSGFKTSQNVIYNIISTKLTILLNKGEGMMSLCNFGNHCVKGFKANTALFQQDFLRFSAEFTPAVVVVVVVVVVLLRDILTLCQNSC